MECYSTDFLRQACKDYKIPHSRLTKKEMYDKLVEIDAITKDPRKNEPTPLRHSSCVKREASTFKEGPNFKEKEKKEKHYLGEEFRDYEKNF